MAPFARVAPPTDARRGARVAYIVQDLSDSHGAGYGVRQATTRRARAARSAPAAQSCATKLQAGSKAVGRDLVRILFSWFGRLARRIRGRPHMLGRAPCAVTLTLTLTLLLQTQPAGFPLQRSGWCAQTKSLDRPHSKGVARWHGG